MDDVNKIAAERQYKNRDEITISPAIMGDIYDEKVRTFFNEHLHEDEEIRYILDGGGYFDVRDKDDHWVRIKLDKYDLMIMPAGIYHRFTTDENNVSIIHLLIEAYVLQLRSIPRPCDYLKMTQNGHQSIVDLNRTKIHLGHNIWTR